MLVFFIAKRDTQLCIYPMVCVHVYVYHCPCTLPTYVFGFVDDPMYVLYVCIPIISCIKKNNINVLCVYFVHVFYIVMITWRVCIHGMCVCECALSISNQ